MNKTKIFLNIFTGLGLGYVTESIFHPSLLQYCFIAIGYIVTYYLVYLGTTLVQHWK